MMLFLPVAGSTPNSLSGGFGAPHQQTFWSIAELDCYFESDSEELIF
jgi:hypothetical protein